MTIFGAQNIKTSNLNYPFIQLHETTTENIASDAKIISKLTATENCTSTVRKLIICNYTPRDAFITCYYCSQQNITPETIPTIEAAPLAEQEITFSYIKILQHYRIPAHSTVSPEQTQNIILQPNNFLMLETEEATQVVTVFCTQELYLNSHASSS